MVFPFPPFLSALSSLNPGFLLPPLNPFSLLLFALALSFLEGAAAAAAVEAKTKETEIPNPKTQDGKDIKDGTEGEAKKTGASASADSVDSDNQNQKPPLVAPVMPAPQPAPKANGGGGGGIRKRWTVGQQNDSEVLNEHHRPSHTETGTETQTKGKGKRSTKSNGNKGLDQFFTACHLWGSGSGSG